MNKPAASRSIAHAPARGKNERYVKVPFSLVVDPEITNATMRVYVALASFTDASGHCYPAIATIAKRAGCAKATVKRELKWLEEAWYITRQRRNASTGRRSNLYTLTRGKVLAFPQGSPEDLGVGTPESPN